MFTGLVEEIGRISSIRRGKSSARIKVSCRSVLEDIRIGDSIAVNGICLTAAGVGGDCFEADVMPETLRSTSLGTLSADSPVNLERALRLSDRLGGHLVTGHIDGVGRVIGRRTEADAIWLDIQADPDQMRYIIRKGSVAVEGVSLTVSDLDHRHFSISLIPHSADCTTLGGKCVGDLVNLECDEIAKYVEKMLSGSSGGSGLTLDDLKANGFA